MNKYKEMLEKHKDIISKKSEQLENLEAQMVTLTAKIERKKRIIGKSRGIVEFIKNERLDK